MNLQQNSNRMSNSPDRTSLYLVKRNTCQFIYHNNWAQVTSALKVIWQFTTYYSKCSKCLLLALKLALKRPGHWSVAWSVHLLNSWPRLNQMFLQFIDIPYLFLINRPTILRYGFSRYLQALMHWFGFRVARSETAGLEWCIVLWHQHACYPNICYQQSITLPATFSER